MKLSLHDNLIAEEGGKALVAAVTDNPNLVAVAIGGNQVDHGKVVALQKLCKRNRAELRKQEPLRMKKELYRLMYQEEKLSKAQATLEEEKRRKEIAESDVIKLKSHLIGLKTEENTLLEKSHEAMEAQQTATAELQEQIRAKECKLADLRSTFEKRFVNLQAQGEKEKEERVAAEATLKTLKADADAIAAGNGGEALESMQHEIDESTLAATETLEYVRKRKVEFEALKREAQQLMAGLEAADQEEPSTEPTPGPKTPEPPPKSTTRRPSKPPSSRKASVESITPAPPPSRAMVQPQNQNMFGDPGSMVGRGPTGRKGSIGSNKAKPSKGR